MDKDEKRLHYLTEFQNRRLRETYADFIGQETYGPTCDFFFGQVYTTMDTTERDASFLRLHDHLKVLGGDIIRCMELMIYLQNLTADLDRHLLEKLPSQSIEFDMDTYEDAYFQCDNYESRSDQIALLCNCLDLSHHIFHHFGIGMGLRALHRFHRMIGDATATGFLITGYDAFHPIRDIQPFIEAVDQRERERLDRIYLRL